jgi:DNA-binding GntR family transcriptional regulator
MILAYLMDGNLPAGAPISIDGMARALDVSPTPVREALARLEATGLVSRVALRGYRVAPRLTPEELAQLMDARRVIEPANAALATERATKKLTDALERAVADMRRAPLGPTFAQFRTYWEADERFHRLIAEHTGNRFLLAAYQALGGQVQRFRYFAGVGVTDAAAATSEHAAILEAISRRDPELAAARMETHIRNAKERALASLEAATTSVSDERFQRVAARS